ncbi:hemerythrin [Streptomyces tateyamensis]|uniref:Hemerythrin n=1 Tax=Streptomyces tateyamensis TaxID=565073 RepID=A0A2V4NBD1_9ACTN|nr:hemerythrin domain-containing protein [Streptomyces tateyamensis]PYC75825.1 hemerythrin [Streptomyces tateyamensis]
MSSDAIVLLKQEHKELLRLFKAYRTTPPAELAARGELAQHIVHDLTVHSYLVDEVLYPEVVSLLKDPAHPAVQGYQDHTAVDRLCEEVAERSPEDPGFGQSVEAMLTAALRQMEREEREWFPLLRATLSRRDLQQIGTHVLAVRETAPRHLPEAAPHPDADQHQGGPAVPGAA